MHELESMINIGTALAKQLTSVGIETPEALREIGSREAWLRIRSVDPSACLLRLSALEGAVQNIRWHHLDEDVKTALKAFYQQHQ